MINHDDTSLSGDTLPLHGDTAGLPARRLSAVMDALQTSGLLGLTEDKRRSALRSLPSEDVKKLQTALRDAGFTDVGEIDGIGGRNTFKAIGQALAKNTLNEILAEENASDSETVRRIQESLNTLGHQSGKVDGVLGPVTSAAIGRFVAAEQASAANLPQDVQTKLREYEIPLAETKQAEAATQPDLRTLRDPSLLAVLGAYDQNEDDIKLLQGFLKNEGYDVGAVDGDFGPRTTREFVKFLEEHPEYHPLIGPNLLLETEIYATEHKVSADLARSLNLRDLTTLNNPSDELRYKAYQDYFTEGGKPVELARGIKVASQLTGVPMENIFVVMKQESIDFGDYNPRYGNSSANRMANNYGQFIDSDAARMTHTYGARARNELGREGIQFDSHQEWRNNPLIAPYMVALRLKESGSTTDLETQYPTHVLPAFETRRDSKAIVARVYPDAAASNRHIFYEGGRPLSFAESHRKIVETLDDDIAAEREIVMAAQREQLKSELLMRQERGPVLDDTLDPRHLPRTQDRFAGLVGDRANPEVATARLNLGGAFARAADLLQIADLDPNGKGPEPGPGPTRDFALT